MQYRFVSNLILVLLLNFLVKPFWIFGIDRSVQIAVGTEQYGSFYALLSFSFLFNIFLDFGITNFNNKSIAASPGLLKKYFSRIFSIKLLLGLFYISVSSIFAFIADYSSEQIRLLSVLFFNQFLVSMILYLRSNISGLLFFKMDSVVSVLDRLLMILFCGAILWGNFKGLQMSIELFVYAQTVAYAITFSIALVFVLVKASNKTFSFSYLFSVKIIKTSLPYALLILVMTLYTRIDVVMLERMLETGKEEAGKYAHSYRILEALNMIAFLFAGLLLPLYSRILAKNQNVKELTSLSSKLLLYPASVVVFCCFMYAEQIMKFLYAIDYAEVYETFGILIITFIPISVGYIYGTLLTANGSLKLLNQISITALVLNITLNSMLIPNYGAFGAAIATLITQSIAAIFQVLFAFQLFNLVLNKEWMLKSFGFLILCVLIYNSVENFSIKWEQGALLVFGILITYGFITKFIDLKSLYAILKEKR